MRLLCVGDLALVNEPLSPDAWMPPPGLVPGEDMRVLFNWELPIGNTVNPVPRSSGRRLLAHPSSLGVIRNWAPGFAALATNHCLDAGPQGLANTIDSLDRAGFGTVGAGRTREEMTRPLIWETAEGRLAIVNWVFEETHPDWLCVPGPNCWPGIDEAKSTIQNLKRGAEWVLIVVHWSDELFPYPRPEDRILARGLAHMGADVVVGHHPHVVRGMETFGTCPVYYSVGNFYFSNVPDGKGGWISRSAPRNREALGIEISLQRGRQPECRSMSFWQKRREVIVDPLRRAARRMAAVSRPLARHEDSAYVDWYMTLRKRFDWLDYRWHFGLWKMGRGGLRRNLLKFFSHLSGTRLPGHKPAR